MDCGPAEDEWHAQAACALLVLENILVAARGFSSEWQRPQDRATYREQCADDCRRPGPRGTYWRRWSNAKRRRLINHQPPAGRQLAACGAQYGGRVRWRDTSHIFHAPWSAPLLRKTRTAGPPRRPPPPTRLGLGGIIIAEKRCDTHIHAVTGRRLVTPSRRRSRRRRSAC